MIKELKTKVMKGYDKAVEFSTKYEDYILIGDIVILSTLGLLLIGKKLKSMDTKSLKQMF